MATLTYFCRNNIINMATLTYFHKYMALTVRSV